MKGQKICSPAVIVHDFKERKWSIRRIVRERHVTIKRVKKILDERNLRRETPDSGEMK